MGIVKHFDYYIYVHTFENNVVYIGKGRKKRAFNFNTRNSYWNRLSNKYGLPSVSFLYIDLADKESYKLEIEAIKLYKNSGYTLCNFTDGGEGLLGFNHSGETIAKIKKTKSENPYVYSEEEKEQNGKRTKKWIEENGHPFKGKNHSELAKASMSKKRKGKQKGCKNPNYNHNIYDLVHKEYGIVSLTVDEFNVQYGLSKCNIYRVLNSKRKSVNGFKLY